MYLSQIRLDLGRLETMEALDNPNIFHGAVEECLPTAKTAKKGMKCP